MGVGNNLVVIFNQARVGNKDKHSVIVNLIIGYEVVENPPPRLTPWGKFFTMIRDIAIKNKII